MSDQEEREVIPVTQAVECVKCGTLHKLEADSFVTIAGNIMVGLEGGVVGPNLDDDYSLTSASIYCRKTDCTQEIIDALRGID